MRVDGTRRAARSGGVRRGEVEAWGRGRLLAVLAAVAVAALAVIGGLVLVVVWALSPPSPTPRPGSGHPAAGPGVDRREVIAAAAMVTVGAEEARGGTPAAVQVSSFTVPAPNGTGPAEVATGFPHSPAGAVGQLAAIVTAATQRMTVAEATRIYQGWALPAGTGPVRWSMTANVQAFWATAGRSLGQQNPGSPPPRITATAVAAQVKGTDGPDWVLACVLVDVRALLTQWARIGYGHCERMQWDATSRRWMIGPGTPPAAAPSTWPGTEAAVRAGWRTWIAGPAGAPIPAPASAGRG